MQNPKFFEVPFSRPLKITCLVPDDSISRRSYPLFVARALFEQVINELSGR